MADKGWGIVADEDIHPGAFVMEYIGKPGHHCLANNKLSCSTSLTDAHCSPYSMPVPEPISRRGPG